jgi:hypothetical protein
MSRVRAGRTRGSAFVARNVERFDAGVWLRLQLQLLSRMVEREDGLLDNRLMRLSMALSGETCQGR